MKKSHDLDLWLARPPSRNWDSDTVPLLCFPYAGAGASIYYNWTKELPTEVDVCPIQLPGREHRLLETPFADLEALVESLAQVIQPHLSTPFVFFGHSMGALISFELARRLHQVQQSPSHLFVSGCSAPQLYVSGTAAHQWTDEQLLEELRRINGTPEEVLQDRELMELLLPVLRADFSLCETYSYRASEPLPCPITVFGGQQDREISIEELEGWRDETTREFTLHLLPGDHFFLQSAKSKLLQVLSAELIKLVRSKT